MAGESSLPKAMPLLEKKIDANPGLCKQCEIECLFALPPKFY